MVIKRTKLSMQAPSDDEEPDELDGADAGDPEEEGPVLSGQLVKKFIRMWPRSIFSTSAGDGMRGTIASTIPELKMPGVYILYRDDVPFYVGQAKGKLRSRLRGHANNVGPLRSYF